MANRDILAIGTSAGGVEALLFLARHFPADFPAAILVTIHPPSRFRSTLDDILNAAGALRARFAEDGERPRNGHIHIAPPDCHLLLDEDKIHLGHGPRENNTRPAIDPMLRSVALCCGPRAIGVVLTGTLGDGASGLRAIHQCGGLSVVQDPNDAAFPEMPLNALDRVTPDHVVALATMPSLLDELARQKAGEPVTVPEAIRMEVEIARNGGAGIGAIRRRGARITCSTRAGPSARRNTKRKWKWCATRSGAPIRSRRRKGSSASAN